MGCMVYSWRLTCDNKKQTILLPVIWTRELQRPPKGLKFAISKGGRSNELRGFNLPNRRQFEPVQHVRLNRRLPGKRMSDISATFSGLFASLWRVETLKTNLAQSLYKLQYIKIIKTGKSSKTAYSCSAKFMVSFLYISVKILCEIMWWPFIFSEQGLIWFKSGKRVTRYEELLNGGLKTL